MKKFTIVLILCALAFACKAPDSTTTWKLTVDLNGGTGLSQTVYEVEDGKTLDKLSETPTFNATKDMINPPANIGRVLNGYKSGSTDFVLGQTQVKSDLTITAQWGFDPQLVCTAKTITDNPIIAYAEKGDIVGVACSLKNGASITQLRKVDEAPILVVAAESGSVELVKYLLNIGSRISEKDNNNFTALIKAATYANLETIKYLLTSAGANINEKDIFGMTALMRAVTQTSEKISGDRLKTVDYLANYPGRDLNARAVATAPAYEGLTALGIAKYLYNATKLTLYDTMATHLQNLGATE